MDILVEVLTTEAVDATITLTNLVILVIVLEDIHRMEVEETVTILIETGMDKATISEVGKTTMMEIMEVATPMVKTITKEFVTVEILLPITDLATTILV